MRLIKLKINNHVTILVVLLFFLVQCTHVSTVYLNDREPNAIANPVVQSEKSKTQSAVKDWLTELPGDGKLYIDQVRKQILSNKKNILPTPALENATARIAKYVSFVMYNYPISLTKKLISDKLILRLFQSSVQFILCTDLNDLACIEKTPLITPTSTHRIEDPKLNLGTPVVINDELEKNMDFYFNQQIFVPQSEFDANKGVAKVLENKIKSLGQTDSDALYMAIYGMDDISGENGKPGSLAGVYNSIVDLIDKKVSVYGVFDQSGAQPGAKKPIIFSYVKPSSPEAEKNWILSPVQIDAQSPDAVTVQSAPNISDLTNLNFQYNGGTQGLIKKLSENIVSEEQSRGRIEWRDNGIMHNKFFVFKENNKFSVWTGTANISRTCLGTERNSNLSVIINNDEIAKNYLTEFQEMYAFVDPASVKPEAQTDFIGANNKNYFPRGKFHTAKSPNTKRYFQFIKDKTDLRMYFSPTDDAEHRALLPMLLSARPGDQILISMFGAAGIEYARALQWAAARGVDVQIIVDTPTACGSGSWAGRSGDATLIEKNPYMTLTKNYKAIQLHKNDKNKGETWKQNHQKIGLLMRKKTDGSFNSEYFSFGSQNWSQSGNDTNDENIIVLRKTSGPMKIANEFKNHFQNYLWPKSQNIPETGCAELIIDQSADGK